MDEADLLERLVTLFEEQHVAYCVIGGQGVNAYEVYPHLRERVPMEILERLV